MCDSKRQAALALVDLLRHRRCVTLHSSHKLASHGAQNDIYPSMCNSPGPEVHTKATDGFGLGSHHCVLLASVSSTAQCTYCAACAVA
jgi:hypothetical protein